MFFFYPWCISGALLVYTCLPSSWSNSDPHAHAGPHASPHAGPHAGPQAGPHADTHAGPHADTHADPQLTHMLAHSYKLHGIKYKMTANLDSSMLLTDCHLGMSLLWWVSFLLCCPLQVSRTYKSVCWNVGDPGSNPGCAQIFQSFFVSFPFFLSLFLPISLSLINLGMVNDLMMSLFWACPIQN